MDLAKKLYELAYITGEFKLRSGLTSKEYFDKYRFESQPEVLKEIAKQMKDKIPADTEVLAGLEMGGIPIAVALSMETGIPVCFVRKEAKEYGTCKFAEGAEVKDKKVCIVEDVITTGGQVVISAGDLKSVGANINKVICVINRNEDKSCPKLKEAGLDLDYLFYKTDLTN